jgi:hypothetical protein
MNQELLKSYNTDDIAEESTSREFERTMLKES